MSQIYNKLSEIQKQKKSEAIALPKDDVSDDILPPFSRSSKKTVVRKNKLQPNVLFILIIALSGIAIIVLLFFAHMAGTQGNILDDKITFGLQLAGIKSTVGENSKGLGQLATFIKGLDKSVASMDERLEAANMRFVRLERYAANHVAEISALRKENSKLLERIETLERKLNIKSDSSGDTQRKKRLFGL